MLTSWRRIVKAALIRAGKHDLSLAAAGAAYFALLSLAPSLAALVSLYGVFGDPASVRQIALFLHTFAPAEVAVIADEQLTLLTNSETAPLAFTALVNFLLALWSANTGVNAFLRTLAQLDEDAPRSFLQSQIASIRFTLGGIFTAIVALSMLTAIPAALSVFQFEGDWLLEAVRWPILVLAVAGYTTMLYRWGLHRPARPWRFAWPAALAATLLWLLASSLAGLVIGRFAATSAVYGSVAGAAGLALWLFVSAGIFLFGAALASVAEAEAKSA